MTDRSDPLDDLEQPTLAEQVAPYRGYGDTELALSLLAFHKQHAVSLRSLGYNTDQLTFDVRCRPADTGANYHCPDCNEPVRGISKPGDGILSCPLCGETPGALVLGQGVDSE